MNFWKEYVARRCAGAPHFVATYALFRWLAQRLSLESMFQSARGPNSDDGSRQSGSPMDLMNAEQVHAGPEEGLLPREAEMKLQTPPEQMNNVVVSELARKARDFKRADEIRDELLAQGIILEDTREGVKWKRA